MAWLEEQNKNREDYKNDGKYQRRLTFRNIICNKLVKGWLCLTIFACSAPILVFYFVIDQGTYKISDSYTCLVQDTFRVPCGKINITSEDCEQLQCCFDRHLQVCYHYLPSRYSYDLHRPTKEYVAAQSTTPYGTDSVMKLKITVNEIDENKVSIILHEDNATVKANTLAGAKNYTVQLVEEKLMVEVHRPNKDLLLTTSKGPLIASETYWEWSFYLTNQTLFGLNQTLINIDANSTISKVIYKSKGDHYTLPVLWAYFNRQFHGVTVKHDGPLEIVVMPSNMVLLKSLTGQQIELEVSVGPTPKLLHDQQVNDSGLPPYWALDTHVCRRGGNINLTDLIRDYDFYNDTHSDCLHENLLMGIMQDNGINVAGVRNILNQIKEQGVNFVLPLPPHILVNATTLYTKAEELDVLYKYNNTVYKGQYMNQEVVYPDYSHSNIQSYLDELDALLGTYMNISDIDGFVLFDNWPVNEGYRMNNSYFPYFTEDLRDAISYSLPWNATNPNSTLHIKAHNSYGSAQMSSLINYYNPTKPDMLMMSATKTFGEVQPSIIQNVDASWTNLQLHMDNVLFNSVVGNHLVSVPICGDTNSFDHTLQERLCIRWYLVAATMPTFRISSTEPWRDPEDLGTMYAQQAAVKAVDYRKMLLPYYYTLLSRNEPVVRPMFYDYHENITTFSLPGQYMIGEQVLFAHPLTSGRTKLQVYLPSRVGIWYELWGGEMYNTTVDAWVDVDIVETDLVGFVAQGSILPLKVDDTYLDLIIALNCTAEPCLASGVLFLENYVNFVANETSVTVSDIPQQNCNYTLGNIRLYSYINDTSDVFYYNKTEYLCTGEGSITLNFESEGEV